MLCGASLIMLVAATGCTSGDGRSIDGSCWDGQTRVTAVDGGTGRTTWSLVLKHPREDRPEATSDAVLVRGCGIVVLATAAAAASTDSARRQRRRAGGIAVGHARPRRQRHLYAPGPRPVLRAVVEPPYDVVAVAGGDLVVGLDSQLSAYGMPPSGQPRWEATFPAADDATLTLAAGVLVVHGDDGSLYRVDPRPVTSPGG